MATIRETILSYPSLDDCETYLDNVVMVKRRINGGDECTPDNIGQAMLCAADLYAMVVQLNGLLRRKAFYYPSP